jgi:hypothetical protein
MSNPYRSGSPPEVFLNPIRTVRVDVPLRKGAVLYFFVSPSHQKWDPWWARLFEFLRAFVSAEASWTLAEMQKVLVQMRSLSEAETAQLLEELRTAPPAEIEGHRSLRRSIKELSRRNITARLVFFKAP